MSADIQKLIGSWKRFNFDGQSAKLAEHVAKVAEYEELTKRRRATLVTKTKEFVKLAEGEKLEHLGPLVKEYQGAVDLLTKRSSASEQLIVEMQAALGNVVDPAPVLLDASSALAEIEALRAKVKRGEEQAKAFQKLILDSEQELMQARAGGGGGGGGGVAVVAPAASGANDEELAKLREEIAKLQQENGRLKSIEFDLMRTATQLSEAKMQLADMGSSARRAKDNGNEEALKQQVAQLKGEVSDTNALLSSMQEIADDAQAQLGEANVARNELVAKCDTLTQALEAKSAQLDADNAKSAALEQKLTEAVANVTQQQHNASAALQLQVEEWKRAADVRASERDRVAADLAALSKAHEVLVASVASTEARHSETEKTLAAKVEEAKREKSELVAEIAQLQQYSSAADNEKHSLLAAQVESERAKHAASEQAYAAKLAEVAAKSEATVAEKQAEISHLKSERDRLAAEAAQSLSALETARQQEAALTVQVDKWKREAESHRVESVGDSGKLAALAQQSAEKDAQIAQRKSEREQYEAKANQAAETARVAAAALAAQLTSLKQEVEQLRNSAARPKDESESVALLAQIEKTLGVVASGNAQDVNARQAAIAAWAASQTAEIKSLHSQISDLTVAQRSQQKASEMEIANALNKHNQQRAAAEAEHAEIKARVEELTATNDALKHKVHSVQKQYDELRMSADEKVDSIRVDLAKAQSELASSIAKGGESAELRKKLEAANALVEERSKALAEMKQKSTAAVNQLREKNAQLTQKLSEISARDSESANEATAELRIQNAQLQSSMETMVRKMDEVQRQDELISAKNKELMTNIDFLQSEVSELRREAKSSGAGNNNGGAANAAKSAEVAELQGKLAAEQGKSAQLSARLSELEKELERQNGRCEQANQRIAHLENELGKAASSAKDAAAQKEMQVLQQRQRQLERDNRENLKLVETLQREKFETLELYTQCQKSVERQQKHVQLLEQKVQRFEAANGAGNNHTALGMLAASTALALASWRKLSSCMQPILALPTVQRVTAMLRMTHKEKIDDPLDVSFSDLGSGGGGGGGGGGNNNNDSSDTASL